MEKRIYFRVDNGNHIGNGHISRCINIAQIFKANGWNVIFLSRNHIGSETLNNFPFPRHFIGHGVQDSTSVTSSYSSWLGSDEKSEVDDILNYLTCPELIFIDHYAYTSHMETRLKSAGHKIVALDDINRNHYVDLLFDYFSGSSESVVSSRNIYNHKVGAGLRYSPLNPIFSLHTKIDLRHKIDKILLSLGTTTKVLYEKALLALLKVDLPFTEIIVLSTHDFETGASNKRITFLKSSDKVHELNLEVDFVIGASGVAMFERIVQKIPCVNMVVVDNQLNMKNQFQDDDLHFFGVDLRSISEAELIRYFSDHFIRYTKNKSSRCRCHIDSDGSERIFRHIIQVCAQS